MRQLSLNEVRFLLNELADWRVMYPLDTAHSARPDAGRFRSHWDQLDDEETPERAE